MGKFKKVIVRWHDSNTLHGWQYGEYLAGLAPCDTLGFLVEEDNEKVVIAQTISDMGGQMGITTIAKGCIKSVRKVRVE